MGKHYTIRAKNLTSPEPEILLVKGYTRTYENIDVVHMQLTRAISCKHSKSTEFRLEWLDRKSTHKL